MQYINDDFGGVDEKGRVYGEGPYADTRFNMNTGVELMTTKAPDFLIPEFSLFPKNRITLIGGEGGIGKTSLAIYLGTLLPKDLNVGYLLFEDDNEDFCRKKNTYKTDAENYKNLFYIELTPKKQEDIGLVPTVPELEYIVKGMGTDVLFIDPIAIMMNGKDMNDASKVRQFLSQVAEICKRNNCTIIGIHHSSKGGGRIKDSFTGSHAWRDTARQAISFVRSDSGERYVAIAKSNNSGDGIGWQLKTEIKNGTMVVTGLGEEMSLKEIQKAADSNYKNSSSDENKLDRTPMIITLLKENYGIGEKFTLKDVREISNASSVTAFHRYVNLHAEMFGREQFEKGSKRVCYWFKY